jgi:hypothetical protein
MYFSSAVFIGINDQTYTSINFVITDTPTYLKISHGILYVNAESIH